MTSDNGHKSCQTHCCERHGCKYGYDDCPVVMKQLEQEYPCEYCPSLEDIKAYLKHYQEELDWWGVLNDRKVKKLLQEYREKLKKEKDVR